MEIEIDIDGVIAAVAALRRVEDQLRAAVERAVNRSMDLIEVTIKGRLRLKSHPRRTPTPAGPGEPPALVTGQLMRSVHGDLPRWEGDTRVGTVMPSTVYARIQELGGVTGRGHRTVLPPRPYVTPSAVEAAQKVRDIFDEEIARALAGVT